MKRHPALQDLSRDHFTALNACVEVRRAVTGDRFAKPLATAAAQLVSLWRDGLPAHFDEEEELLVPAATAADEDGSGAPLLTRLASEHADLKARLEALAVAEEAGTAPDAEELQAAADLLRAHIRWEEDELFAWVQESLDAEALEQLRQASYEFRMERRGPESIGPGRA